MKKKELESLLQKYSSKHPDVIRLKKEIAGFEAESKKTTPNKSTDSTKASNVNPLKQVLNTQITGYGF